MLGHYLRLALRTLRRNIVLTALIIAAVGFGIGAYMTVLTVLIAMSGDPIPYKSDVLFVPQIDIWGPNTPPSGIPYSQGGRATDRDFFAMFEVPFKAGAAWSVKDEADRADVVVLGKTLAARLAVIWPAYRAASIAPSLATRGL